VVDESLTCVKDSDCNYWDLQWITGMGTPMSNRDVCCATFPRETWVDTQKRYVKTSTKLCYSKRILSGNSNFNYYRAAYCDGALSGVYAMSLGLAAAILATVAF